MDILDKKTVSSLPSEIKNIMHSFKIDDYNIYIKGTAGIYGLNIYNDFDFYTIINRSIGAKNLYENIMRIMEYIYDDENLYFIKFTIRNKDDSMISWNMKKDFNYKVFNSSFKNIQYAKFDLLFFMNNRFIEISYDIYFDKKNPDVIIGELLDSIKELEGEKNYYKALKRKFTYYDIQKNQKGKNDKEINDKIKGLAKIFNSDLAQKYKVAANLKALQKMKLINNLSDHDKQKILLNLKELNIKPSDKIIETKIKDIEQDTNDKIKNIYPQYTL